MHLADALSKATYIAFSYSFTFYQLLLSLGHSSNTVYAALIIYMHVG